MIYDKPVIRKELNKGPVGEDALVAVDGIFFTFQWIAELRPRGMQTNGKLS